MLPLRENNQDKHRVDSSHNLRHQETSKDSNRDSVNLRVLRRVVSRGSNRTPSTSAPHQAASRDGSLNSVDRRVLRRVDKVGSRIICKDLDSATNSHHPQDHSQDYSQDHSLLRWMASARSRDRKFRERHRDLLSNQNQITANGSVPIPRRA